MVYIIPIIGARKEKQLKKYLVFLVIALLLLAIPQATAFKLIIAEDLTLGSYLKDAGGLLVAYVNEKVEVKDPDKLRVCFLNDAQDFQGDSVEELFDEALPPMSRTAVLLVAMLNLTTFQWIFLYADAW